MDSDDDETTKSSIASSRTRGRLSKRRLQKSFKIIEDDSDFSFDDNPPNVAEIRAAVASIRDPALDLELSESTSAPGGADTSFGGEATTSEVDTSMSVDPVYLARVKQQIEQTSRESCFNPLQYTSEVEQRRRGSSNIYEFGEEVFVKNMLHHFMEDPDRVSSAYTQIRDNILSSPPKSREKTDNITSYGNLVSLLRVIADESSYVMPNLQRKAQHVLGQYYIEQEEEDKAGRAAKAATEGTATLAEQSEGEEADSETSEPIESSSKVIGAPLPFGGSESGQSSADEGGQPGSDDAFAAPDLTSAVASSKMIENLKEKHQAEIAKLQEEIKQLTSTKTGLTDVVNQQTAQILEQTTTIDRLKARVIDHRKLTNNLRDVEGDTNLIKNLDRGIRDQLDDVASFHSSLTEGIARRMTVLTSDFATSSFNLSKDVLTSMRDMAASVQTALTKHEQNLRTLCYKEYKFLASSSKDLESYLESLKRCNVAEAKEKGDALRRRIATVNNFIGFQVQADGIQNTTFWPGGDEHGKRLEKQVSETLNQLSAFGENMKVWLKDGEELLRTLDERQSSQRATLTAAGFGKTVPPSAAPPSTPTSASKTTKDKPKPSATVSIPATKPSPAPRSTTVPSSSLTPSTTAAALQPSTPSTPATPKPQPRRRSSSSSSSPRDMSPSVAPRRVRKVSTKPRRTMAELQKGMPPTVTIQGKVITIPTEQGAAKKARLDAISEDVYITNLPPVYVDISGKEREDKKKVYSLQLIYTVGDVEKKEPWVRWYCVNDGGYINRVNDIARLSAMVGFELLDPETESSPAATAQPVPAARSSSSTHAPAGTAAPPLARRTLIEDTSPGSFGTALLDAPGETLQPAKKRNLAIVNPVRTKMRRLLTDYFERSRPGRSSRTATLPSATATVIVLDEEEEDNSSVRPVTAISSEPVPSVSPLAVPAGNIPSFPIEIDDDSPSFTDLGPRDQFDSPDESENLPPPPSRVVGREGPGRPGPRANIRFTSKTKTVKRSVALPRLDSPVPTKKQRQGAVSGPPSSGSAISAAAVAAAATSASSVSVSAQFLYSSVKFQLKPEMPYEGYMSAVKDRTDQQILHMKTSMTKDEYDRATLKYVPEINLALPTLMAAVAKEKKTDVVAAPAEISRRPFSDVLAVCPQHPKTWVCSHCVPKKTLRSHSELFVHCHEVHGKDKVEKLCPYCLDQVSRYTITAHVAQHFPFQLPDGYKYGCLTCVKAAEEPWNKVLFKEEVGYLDHLAEAHNAPIHFCAYCGKRYKTMSSRRNCAKDCLSKVEQMKGRPMCSVCKDVYMPAIGMEGLLDKFRHYRTLHPRQLHHMVMSKPRMLTFKADTQGQLLCSLPHCAQPMVKKPWTGKGMDLAKKKEIIRHMLTAHPEEDLDTINRLCETYLDLELFENKNEVREWLKSKTK